MENPVLTIYEVTMSLNDTITSITVESTETLKRIRDRCKINQLPRLTQLTGTPILR